MIDGLVNSGAIPALERLMQFSGARHRIISHNIANLSTPDFRPADVSVAGFQKALGRAIDERRQQPDRAAGAGLDLRDTSEITFGPGRMNLHPKAAGDNILFHDGNDRSLERTMQDLVENFMVFRQASELLRSRMDLIQTAIRERM